MNKNPLSELLKLFEKLSTQQKIVIGSGVIATFVILGLLLTVLSEPKLSTLYTNLNEQDAAKVIDYLNNEKIAYKLDKNGTVIKVPADLVYETRLTLASKGIPNSGVVGYEIFDKNTIGMSEFMQKLNYKRALEGELARTIMQQDGIENARVHIVIPNRSLFKDEQKPPTASVLLGIRSGHTLNNDNVMSIVHLISSSVEGLEPQNVTLINSKGHTLFQKGEENSLAEISSTQYDLKKSVEKYLSAKAQNILDNVLGYGNSIVQVDAELNFDQVEKTMESYDPESQVAISEQSVKTENSGVNISDSTSNVSENNTVNYEINKTIQKVIEGTGNIHRLTVAAVVNDIPVEKVVDGAKQITYKPRNQEQINKLEIILKNALGINEIRKDNFSIVSMPFEQNTPEKFDFSSEPAAPQGFNFYNTDKWINLALILVAIIASLLILRSLLQKIKKEKPLVGNYPETSISENVEMTPALETGSSAPQLPAPKKKKWTLPVGDLEDEISDEAMLKRNQQDKIANYVSKNPVDAAKLINAWLHENE